MSKQNSICVVSLVELVNDLILLLLQARDLVMGDLGTCVCDPVEETQRKISIVYNQFKAETKGARYNQQPDYQKR